MAKCVNKHKISSLLLQSSLVVVVRHDVGL